MGILRGRWASRIMAAIITSDSRRKNFGKTRAEHERNLRSEGYQTMSDETLDKMKFMEKRYPGGFIPDSIADEVEG